MRSRRFEAGFSLTELIVSLGLFSIVVTMVFSFLEQARRNVETESSGIETQQGARVAVEELAFNIRQAGYGIDRTDPANPATWQRAVIWAGPHAIAFNADIDPARGPIDPTIELEFPDGSLYVGEGPAGTSTGAETYYYTLDADGDDRISRDDRRFAEIGSYNPATDTDNPLDYALFRRVHGYAGDDEDLAVIDPVTPYLFTNATDEDRYADGSVPEPLLTYWLTEDIDGDGALSDHECVRPPCPAIPPRAPARYLWGDDDFNGVLSDYEKDALRDLPVGDPDWAGNPLVVSGALPSTDLAEAVSAGVRTLEVDDAYGFAYGLYVSIGYGEERERVPVASVDMSTVPNRIALAAPTRNAHVAGDPVEVLPDVLLRAIRTVQVRFGAITPRRDFDATQNQAAIGRAGRVGTGGLEYRVLPFERRLGLPNLSTRPAR